jgi:hypothetical protein
MRTSLRSGRLSSPARQTSKAALRGTQVRQLSSSCATSTTASSTSSRCSLDIGRSMPISSSRLAAQRRLRWYASHCSCFVTTGLIVDRSTSAVYLASRPRLIFGQTTVPSRWTRPMTTISFESKSCLSSLLQELRSHHSQRRAPCGLGELVLV